MVFSLMKYTRPDTIHGEKEIVAKSMPAIKKDLITKPPVEFSWKRSGGWPVMMETAIVIANMTDAGEVAKISCFALTIL
jgi:hypothetical protein